MHQEGPMGLKPGDLAAALYPSTGGGSGTGEEGLPPMDDPRGGYYDPREFLDAPPTAAGGSGKEKLFQDRIVERVFTGTFFIYFQKCSCV